MLSSYGKIYSFIFEACYSIIFFPLFKRDIMFPPEILKQANKQKNKECKFKIFVMILIDSLSGRTPGSGPRAGRESIHLWGWDRWHGVEPGHGIGSGSCLCMELCSSRTEVRGSSTEGMACSKECLSEGQARVLSFSTRLHFHRTVRPHLVN